LKIVVFFNIPSTPDQVRGRLCPSPRGRQIFSPVKSAFPFLAARDGGDVQIAGANLGLAVKGLDF
jgi:hypothetical protein